MALDSSLPYGWDLKTTSIIAGTGTQAKVLVDKYAATGNFLGGCRIIDGSISSTDGTARSILIWMGEEVTLASAMGTASIATTSTITRSTGDFVADGWRVGDSFMIVEGAGGAAGTTAANYRNVFQLTAVSSTTLTVNGTGLTAETIVAGSRIVRVAIRTRRAVAISAGNADATPAVALMGGTQDPAAAALPDTGWQLGANTLLLVSSTAAISALPARIDFMAHVAKY